MVQSSVMIAQKVILAAFAFSTLGLCQDPQRYTLVNATNHQVVVNFQYSGGVIPVGGVTSATFQPGAQNTYCFQGYSATANIATPSTTWDGNRPMIMGNTAGSLPTGPRGSLQNRP